MAAASTYEPIATTTLGAAASTITFSSIPATYTDLRLILVSTTTAADAMLLYFNNTTSTLYSSTYLSGNGSAAAVGNFTTATQIYLDGMVYNTSATIPFFYAVDILSYGGATYKTCLLTKSGDINGAGGETAYQVGLFRSTSAISRLDLKMATTTFKSGTTATLYGIKAA